MASITCGSCKGTHSTVAEVKACYGNVHTTTATITVATKTTAEVPDSHYALSNLAGHANQVTFFSVKHGKAGGKWEHFQFVTRLVGGEVGSFVEYPVKGDAKAIILRKIADDPKAAAKMYADEFSVCARCGRTLTDDTSRAMGLGPDCAEKF